MFDQHESDRQTNDRLELPAELAALERELAGLSPAALQLDRDRLMFAAGRASAGQDGRAMYITGSSWSGSRIWPAATALMTAASVLLAAMLVFRSPPAFDQPHVADVAVTQPSEDASDEGIHAPADAEPTPTVADAAYATTDRWSAWPWSGPPTTGYLAARHVALTWGIAALERRSAATTTDSVGTNGGASRPPATARELLRELLPEAAPPTGARG